MQVFVKHHLVTLALIVLSCFVAHFLSRHALILNTQRQLHDYLGHVEKLVVVRDGVWDLSRYNADPRTPHPHGSSGYTDPFYLISKDGDVIERTNPIAGYLDASDARHILQFTTINTTTTATGERWRTYSQAITHNNEYLGVMMVSAYTPNQADLKTMDERLKYNMRTLQEQIAVGPSYIDASKVDISKIDYYVAFEIVDDNNLVLINNGRLPVRIDVSHLANEYKQPNERIIKNESTGARYYLIRKSIKDSKGRLVGVVIAAHNLEEAYGLLNYQLTAILSGIALIVISTSGIGYLIQARTQMAKEIHSVFFDKKLCNLSINDQQVDVAYASNQFYVLSAVFGSPTRRWESDELLQKIGDENGNARSIYDAVLAINKKARLRLIEYKDQTYFLNKKYLHKISS